MPENQPGFLVDPARLYRLDEFCELTGLTKADVEDAERNGLHVTTIGQQRVVSGADFLRHVKQLPPLPQVDTPDDGLTPYLRAANHRAMEEAKADREFAEKPTVRKWSKRLDIAKGSVLKLPFFQQCSKRAGTLRGPRVKHPNAEPLTAHEQHRQKEQVIAEFREQLQRDLLEDSRRDAEPSPCQDAQTKVFGRKQV